MFARIERASCRVSRTVNVMGIGGTIAAISTLSSKFALPNDRLTALIPKNPRWNSMAKPVVRGKSKTFHDPRQRIFEKSRANSWDLGGLADLRESQIPCQSYKRSQIIQKISDREPERGRKGLIQAKRRHFRFK